MKKFISCASFGLLMLLFFVGNAEARCGSRGWWGYSQAPTYRYYSSAPAPAAATPAVVAQGNHSYRSFSYEPGTSTAAPAAVQPYSYGVPRSYAPSPPNMFQANRKMFGLQN